MDFHDNLSDRRGCVSPTDTATYNSVEWHINQASFANRTELNPSWENSREFGD